jgi:hypothetical protein
VYQPATQIVDFRHCRIGRISSKYTRASDGALLAKRRI